MAMEKMTFAAIIFCGRDYAALTRSLEMELGENVKRVFLFGGDAPKRYEIPPKASELLGGLTESGNGAIFYNPDLPETLTKIDAYLRESGANAWFFLNAGDTVHTLYTSYLESFFSYNKGKCGVVFAPVLTDGITKNLVKDDPRLPETFQDLPKNGLFSYADDYEWFPNNEDGISLLDGAAVLAEDALAAGLDFEKGAGAFADLVERAAQTIGKFGKLQMIYLARGEMQGESITATDTMVAASATNAATAPKYAVSCVIPVYNGEKYLSEAVDSVINQSIGFEKCVQLILVNDGSTDASGEICEEYLEKYPDNVVYIKQANKGVSAARNAGLGVAEGEFISFLDADDRMSENYLAVAVKTLSDNIGADFVAFPLDVFTDGSADNAMGLRHSAAHPLDWKFERNALIDVREKPEYVQFHVASTVIRRDALVSLRFDEELSYGEDAEFLHRLLLNNPVYSVCVDACLEYRKHGGSAMGRERTSAGWYEKLRLLPQKLIDASRKANKTISAYSQECIMYDLQWYAFKEKPAELPLGVDWSALKGYLVDAVKNVGDEVIKSAKYLTHWQKAYLLILKYGMPNCLFDGNGLRLEYWRGVSEEYAPLIRLNNVEERGNIIKVACHSQFVYPEKFNVIAMYGNEKITGRRTMRNDDYYLGECVHQECYFDFDFNYDKLGGSTNELSFYVEITGVGVFPAPLAFDTQCRLRNRTGAFVLGENVIVTRSAKTNALRIVERDLDVLKKLIKADGELLTNYIRAYGVMSKRRIWLFMDRLNKADDNAEHLFRYAVRQNDGVEKYFVIGEDCADYERIKEYGAVVAFGSDEHKLLMLFAEKFIASNFDNQYRYPFNDEEQSELLKSLCRAEYVFLQHGVTKDDMSPILNRWQRNIKLFVTAGKAEYNAILSGGYGYDAGVVKLTGFPRFDGLNDVGDGDGKETVKTIVFVPTWRQTLAVGLNREGYNPRFKDTAYFKSINEVLSSAALIDGLEKLGYRLAFRPHPVLYAQLEDFEIDERVKVIENDESYPKTIAESDLLVTDYSSVAFDSAYLGKPVIYYQFDEGNWRGGYFDYVDNGFGEVVGTLDEFTATVLKYAEGGCEMPERYRARAERFFAYRDGDNCKRVYEALTT